MSIFLSFSLFTPKNQRLASVSLVVVSRHIGVSDSEVVSRHIGVSDVRDLERCDRTCKSGNSGT